VVVLMKKECVVMLHGLGPTLGNLAAVERTLKHQDYSVLNIKYPSLRYDLEKLSTWLNQQPRLKELWNSSEKVHFVTLSMGGILLLRYLDAYKTSIPAQKLGRVVMLGPPHGGSEMADLISRTFLSRLLGPAGKQLTTDKQRQNKVRPWYELGIIAGNKFSGGSIMRGTHDGCVTVESTKTEGMKDHITLSTVHGFLGWNKNVRRQIVNFLKNGKFDHET
jgi:triacylglycerol esterase/lipase EstA (alpha/beta hydrolase family)